MTTINKCPKCGSTNCYVDKRGFSGKKAIVGTLAAGPIGAAAGTINSNRIKITCLDCGYSYYAGECKKERAKIQAKGQPQKFSAIIWMILSAIFAFLAFLIWLIFGSLFFGCISAAFSISFLITGLIKLLNQ